jgi:hypothetical protein
MLKRLWAWATQHVVSDVPAEISACLDCGKIQCVDSEFRNCPTRLARAAALKAMQRDAATNHDGQAQIR